MYIVLSFIGGVACGIVFVFLLAKFLLAAYDLDQQKICKKHAKRGGLNLEARLGTVGSARTLVLDDRPRNRSELLEG